MSVDFNRRRYLLLGSAALLAAILVSLGFLLNAGRINRLEGQTLQEAILSQNSWLNRLVLAVSETSRELAVGPGGPLSGDQQESFRALLSQARMVPDLPGPDSLRAILGDDPLMIIPQLEESDAEYDMALAELETLQRALVNDSTASQTGADAAELHSQIDAFGSVLAARGNVITQLEATLHGRLRTVQRTTGRLLTTLLLFQLVALAFGSLLVAAVFKAQAKRVSELETLIPICSRCKSVRDDTGYWERVESYMSSHTEMRFTHGLCPTCVTDLYPMLDEEEEEPEEASASAE